MILVHPADPDSDSVLMSRERIEDKLVEEYKTCIHFKETKEELGGSIQLYYKV